MSSFWHGSVLGIYNPRDQWIGLDFRKLFLDPLRTRLTHVHELTHSVLFRSTDFGQATQVICELLPLMKHISREEKKNILEALRNSQLLVQEGTASLIQILSLKGLWGKQKALEWANQNLSKDYLERFLKLAFVLDMGERYKENFTKKVPHLALHTAVRKKIVSEDLFSDPRRFVSYLAQEENNPDSRFQKMIDVTRSKTYLSTKESAEICRETGTELHSDVSKSDVASFLNYMLSFTDRKHRFSASDIREVKEVDFPSEANDRIIIANMAQNLRRDATIVWDLGEFLKYRNQMEAVMVNLLTREDVEDVDVLDMLMGRKFEAAIVAYLQNGEKYMIGLDIKTVSSLLRKELSSFTLLVKWGLYKPGLPELLYFAGSRKPNVVIYNQVQNLHDNFKEWFKQGNKTEYLHMGVSRGHPFQVLAVKDENEVLHIVNTFKKPLYDFIQKHKGNLIKAKPSKFLTDTKHYNNVLAVWMGMPWDVDWYATMLDGKEIQPR